MALDIGAAGIDRPDRVRDLAAEQLVISVAGAERHIGLALRQIEVAIAGDELDAKRRMFGVEAVDERRHAVDDRLRASHPDDTRHIMRDIAHTPLQLLDCGFDVLGIGA